MAAVGSLGGQSQLLGYARTLWRRKWTIVLIAVIATVVAFGVSKTETPTYQATAQLLFQPTASQSVLGSGALFATPNVSDDISLIESPRVAAIVLSRIGSVPPMSATNVSGTDLIDIAVTSTVPADAARAANAYADAYLSYERRQTVSNLLASARVVQHRISSIQSQISALQTTAATQSGAAQAATQARIAGIEQQLTTLTGQLNTLQSSAALDSAGAELIVPATPPTSPSSPRTLRNTLFGFGGGIVIGLALAFVRENLDDTVGSREDLERAQPDLPVLAQIPYEAHPPKAIPLVSVVRPHSAGAEAYRSLRTSVQFLTLERSLRTLQVTSPKSGDGKTTTVANLAVALAGAGQRVIVLDCDLRRPRLHEPFGVANEVGFTSVLLGDSPISAVLQEPPGFEGRLRILSSGPHLSNPSELLSSQRTAEVLASLSGMADLIVIDSPPVLPVTDAVALAPRVDATLMVVSSGQTTAKDLARSLEVLGQVAAPVVGAVLNAVVPESRYGGYRYRGYRYEPYRSTEVPTSTPIS